MSLLELSALSVRYGDLVAVHEVDLALDEGEVAVVVGANGAGKSSLLGAVSGLVPVAGGAVRFDGRDATRWSSHRTARAGVVLVPEGRRVFAPLTVEENLLVGGYGQRDRRRQAEVLASVYAMFPVLAERAGSPSGLLSGGEQQMLAFGRALMGAPRVLLLDEPSMGLAPIMVDIVVDAVRQIAATGISILMVEQNAAAAFGVASRAHVLENGRIVLSGPTAEVADDPLVLRAFLGIAPVEDVR